jgi:hypothetical protein
MSDLGRAPCLARDGAGSKRRATFKARADLTRGLGNLP